MNVSSARNLIDWRISRCCKLVSFCAICASVVVGSFSLPASASTVDTSDWLEVDVTPYVLYCDYPSNSSSYVQLYEDEGLYYYNLFNFSLNHQRVMCLSTEFDQLYKDCTYQLTFTVKYTNFSVDGHTFGITSTLPSAIQGLQYNSNGTDLADLVDITTKTKYWSDKNPEGYTQYIFQSCSYEYTILFSTADGYVDTFSDGTQYVNLENWVEYVPSSIIDNTMGSAAYWIEITEIDASCVFDPSAEYYLELTKARQNKLVDLTKESVGKMKDSLEQVTIIDDMSSAVDYVSGAIGNAVALISPIATFAGDTVNIYPAFALFSNIYNNVMGSVDPALLALAATVPLLCFLAWLFSSLFKSIL